MALRRWKPFLGAFPLIDAAIEGADPAAGGLLSRDEFRSARGRIIELLCDAAADEDEEEAEGLCVLLDEAMAGSLATLRAVPAERLALASGDLVGAIGQLMKDHASEPVRGLARDVVRGWKADVGAKLARARAAMDLLDGLSSTAPPPPLQDVATTAPPTAADSSARAEKILEEQARPRKTSVVVSNSRRVSTTESYAALSKKRSSDPIVRSSNDVKPAANMGAPAAVSALPKKTPPVVLVSRVAEEGKKIEATKRKLHDHERYQEAEYAKRRRTIQMIKPPRPPPATAPRIAHQSVRPRNCAAESATTVH
nr:unnamed protein product [Digitaria exilis]